VRMLRPPLDRSIRTPGCISNTNMTGPKGKGNELNKVYVSAFKGIVNPWSEGVYGVFPTIEWREYAP
jgi:hypothetical protein